jgi:hypothetical protein
MLRRRIILVLALAIAVAGIKGIASTEMQRRRMLV